MAERFVDPVSTQIAAGVEQAPPAPPPAVPDSDPVYWFCVPVLFLTDWLRGSLGGARPRSGAYDR